MHRIEGAYYDDSGGTNLFQDSSTPGTKVTAAWLNSVQEELANILTSLGGSLSTQGADVNRNQIITILQTAGIAAPATQTINPMEANTTFTSSYGFQKTYFLNPSGGSFNFDPSGTFVDGYTVRVSNINAGVNVITFDSTGIAHAIAVGTIYSFVYELANTRWRVIS